MILPSQDGWQQQLASAARDPYQLVRDLGLDPATAPASIQLGSEFAMRVPAAFARRIRPGDWNDPLLKQVLPLRRETDVQVGYVTDPLAEALANPVPGLVHKYRGRVLLIVSPACAVHCRYCFRRHFPYEDNSTGRHNWQPALDYIRSDTDISEVILSGGDPLAISDRYLADLVTEIETIAHVTRLRIHTRLPVVIPDRVTEQLTGILRDSRLRVVFVLHINHANEIDAPLAAAVARLRASGLSILNQSVLLRGVNDSATVLAALSEALFGIEVMPYYLHLLDPVDGAAHFDVDDTDARALYQELLTLLPGYLVPKLVREEPGEKSKTPLA